MQNSAALAYQQVGQQTVSPRVLEANLLSKSAAQLQRIRDDWNQGNAGLNAALLFNRRLWNVFLNSATSEESRLPPDLRQNIANLGLFVMKHTIAMQTRPEPRKLDVLITINRELAAGLRASSNAEQPAA
jgi:flagellar biosynthesis activator protein FlaF